MSGHSHWAGIKHKKAKEDSLRGRAFSHVSKQVMAAVRTGGKDPDTNLDLKYAIEAAKAVNMPKENIERAILRAAGELPGQKLESVRFEGHGPAGVAVMVDALTDNRKRTVPHVRRIFETHGGELGATGCVSWTFERKGLVILSFNDRTEEQVFELAIESGAEDFQKAGDVYELSCDPKNLHAVKSALQAAGIKWDSGEVTLVPKSYVNLTAEEGRRMLKMMEELEEDEDVTNVYANFNLPPELVAELQEA
jgi:YebC/PmpR family DNA-binding regulatory protein